MNDYKNDVKFYTDIYSVLRPFVRFTNNQFSQKGPQTVLMNNCP